MSNTEARHLDAENTDNSFAQFNLPAALTTALLKMQYNTPTPIQEKAIPVALMGQDILGSARTGTGKTAAFAIPVIARLMTEPQSAALIMSPTRELAAQIFTVLDTMLGRGNPIRLAQLIGGKSMGRQFDQLRGKPRIIIGTPGRINDHLRRNPAMFKQTNLLVLDEADRMLDMGFAPQINDIITTMPKQRQTLMFSATFADSILKFAHTYLTKPERISVDPISVSAVNVKHEVVQTTDGKKYDDLQTELHQREGSVIIFVRTKHGADRLAKRLSENHSTGVIHGGLRQNQRDRAILAFRNKRTRVMVATDVAARGLDIPHIEHVINYDLPQCTEDYIHRVGRTARAGAQGSALCMITPSDRSKWNDIQRLLDGKKGARPQQERNERSGNGGGQKRSGYHSNRGENRGRNNDVRSSEGRSHALRGEGRDYANASARKGSTSFSNTRSRPETTEGFKDAEGRNRFYKKEAPRPSSDSRPERAPRSEGMRHEGAPRSNYGERNGNRDDNRNDSRGERAPRSHFGENRNEGRTENRESRPFNKGPRPEGNRFDGPRPDRAPRSNHGESRGEGRSEYRGGNRDDNRSEGRNESRDNRSFASKGPRPQGENRHQAPRSNRDDNRGPRPFDSKGPRPHAEGKNHAPRSENGGGKFEGPEKNKRADKPFQFKQHSRKPARKGDHKGSHAGGNRSRPAA